MRIKVAVPRGVKWCTFVAALLLPPVLARAEKPPLPPFMRLEYLPTTGKSCPGLEELRDLLIVGAKRDPFNDVAPALLRVIIARRGGHYEATIELRDAAGVNVWPPVPLEPRSSCDGLAQD